MNPNAPEHRSRDLAYISRSDAAPPPVQHYPLQEEPAPAPVQTNPELQEAVPPPAEPLPPPQAVP